ncbi:hypothetical protein HY374_02085 [Candidatus Berkelbacteria bacterium]|nr:hypothetical protein [Candidatus Berkelbacteria bacterium]
MNRIVSLVIVFVALIAASNNAAAQMVQPRKPTVTKPAEPPTTPEPVPEPPVEPEKPAESPAPPVPEEKVEGTPIPTDEERAAAEKEAADKAAYEQGLKVGPGERQFGDSSVLTQFGNQVLLRECYEENRPCSEITLYGLLMTLRGDLARSWEVSGSARRMGEQVARSINLNRDQIQQLRDEVAFTRQRNERLHQKLNWLLYGGLGIFGLSLLGGIGFLANRRRTPGQPFPVRSFAGHAILFAIAGLLAWWALFGQGWWSLTWMILVVAALFGLRWLILRERQPAPPPPPPPLPRGMPVVLLACALGLYANTAFAQTQGKVTGITPDAWVRGSEVEVVITGTGLADIESVQFPTGVTVSGLTATASKVTAKLAIDASSDVGPVTFYLLPKGVTDCSTAGACVDSDPASFMIFSSEVATAVDYLNGKIAERDNRIAALNRQLAEARKNAEVSNAVIKSQIEEGLTAANSGVQALREGTERLGNEFGLRVGNLEVWQATEARQNFDRLGISLAETNENLKSVAEGTATALEGVAGHYSERVGGFLGMRQRPRDETRAAIARSIASSLRAKLAAKPAPPSTGIIIGDRPPEPSEVPVPPEPYLEPIPPQRPPQ